MIDTIIKAADKLDAIGKRDLADALDGLLKKAARQPKPRHKVGDKVHLKEETALPVVSVKMDPRFGPYYQLTLWVLERDLREPEEAEASDHGRELGDTPRLQEVPGTDSTLIR
jgi:hypothetical protein